MSILIFNSGAASGGSQPATEKAIAQTAHGFTGGEWVRHNGLGYEGALADTAAHAEAIGLVTAVADVDNFTLQVGGYVESGVLSGMTPGATQFLSAGTTAAMTETEPTVAGHVSKPLLDADSASTGWILNQRGLVIPAAATTRFRILLIADGTTVTSGEDFASYTYEVGANLDGWSLTDVVWFLKTSSSSGAPSFGIRKGATEMLSTNVTVDATKTSSRTAATPRAINSDGSQTVAAGDILHFDCDAAGTGAKGSAVELEFTSP